MTVGRPTALTAPAGSNDQGETWTTGQRILHRVGLGLAQVDAAKDAGIAIATLHGWKQKGRAARMKAEAGGILTAREAEYAQFLDAFESAEQTAKATLLGAILKAGTERQLVKKVTVKREAREVTHPDGSTSWQQVEVERTEVVEERPAPWTALAWTMERRWPNEFGRRVAVDVQATDGTDHAERVRDLASEAEAYLQGHADAEQPGVIDVVEAAPSGQA